MPVLYAGDDLGCALGETVFHELDDNPAIPAEIFHADLLTLRAGIITVARPMELADLTDVALAGYGASRQEVVATPTSDYPATRKWAQLAWETTGNFGLVWNSRRSPERLAYMLFVDPPDVADRHRAADRRHDLTVLDPPQPLAEDPGLGAVMTAATARNVSIVMS